MARLLIEQRHATSACVQIPQNPHNQSAIARCYYYSWLDCCHGYLRGPKSSPLL